MKPLTDKQLIQLAEHYSANETCLFLNARVRELKVENGKKDAYIVELEERIKKCQSQAMIESLKSIKSETKKEEMYLNLTNQLKSCQQKLKKLHKQQSDSVTEIVRLNAEIERLNNL